MSNIITNTTVNPTPDTVVFIQTKNFVKSYNTLYPDKDRDNDIYDLKSEFSKSQSSDLIAEYETPVELKQIGITQTVFKALYGIYNYNQCVYQ